jgi:hypothetical protein
MQLWLSKHQDVLICCLREYSRKSADWTFILSGILYPREHLREPFGTMGRDSEDFRRK